MDVLANVLGVMQLGKTVLSQMDLVSPWGLEIDSSKTAVHVVQRGSCWLRMENDVGPVRLDPGDVVLVARGVPHVLSDAPDTASRPWKEAMAVMEDRQVTNGREPIGSTILLCAAYEFEQEAQQPLLGLLPKLIRFNIEDDGQFQAVIRLLLYESSHRLVGSEIVVPRLVDSLFVLIVRSWLNSQPVGPGGWFGALRDPQIGRALALIHESPQRDWSVAELAYEVALSRAAFARRFTDLVGEPPLRYVTRWRMNLAAHILRTSGESVDSVAGRVGYESATAFGKAFDRHVGISPGRYRASADRARPLS